MEDLRLINEAGIYYRFPVDDLEQTPVGMTEFFYKRFRNGIPGGGLQRIFILGTSPLNLYKLLDKWNRKALGSGWTYTGVA